MTANPPQPGQPWQPNSGGDQPPGRGTPPPTGPDGQDARPWYKKKRVLIPAGVVAFFVVIAIATGGDDPAPSAEADELIAATEAAEARADEAEARADEAEARLDDVEEAAAAESDETEEAEAEEEADAAAEGDDADGTVAQQNALRSAEDYLAFTAFSRSGLIEQLEFEGFTPEQAEYGVDQTGL